MSKSKENPAPDRLLTINEQRDAMLKYNGLASFGTGSEGIYRALMVAQRDLTASLKDEAHLKELKWMGQEIDEKDKEIAELKAGIKSLSILSAGLADNMTRLQAAHKQEVEKLQQSIDWY